MRVVAGKAKGRRLKSLKGENTRPTSDKVKESLFSILGGLVMNAKILDLFAGTGSLGIEALSRGAEYAVFIDNDRNSVRVINENLNQCGFFEQALVIKKDVCSALVRLSVEERGFDLVFLDPPYDTDWAEPVLDLVVEHHLLAEEALVIVESGKENEINPETPHLTKRREAVYGNSKLTFFDIKPEGEGD